MNTNCKNCHHSFTGQYCNNCGQQANVHELTFKDVLLETWHSVTNTDSGFLRLIKDLFLRPKSVYLNYFAGQRKKYFSPVTFFFVTVGLLLFLGIQVFDYEDFKFATQNEFGRFALLETKFKSLLLLPLEILLTWLLFHKQYNLAKNIVFWLFLNGFLFTIKILLTPIYILFISSKSSIDTYVQIIQYIVLFIHLFLIFGKKKWGNIIILFILTNMIFISDYLLTGYLLFEEAIFKQTGAKNIWELILKAYLFW